MAHLISRLAHVMHSINASLVCPHRMHYCVGKKEKQDFGNGMGKRQGF